MTSPPKLDRLEAAFAYALALHKDDVRKGTAIPYVSHLLNVSGLVLWDGGDQDEAIAGLLHDALEDHPEKTSRAEIERLFGDKVASIVAGCSDTPDDYRGGTKPPWRNRKELYLRHLHMADVSTLRVSMADKLDNARAVLSDYRRLGDELWSRFNAGKEDQLWYYRMLVETFRSAGSDGLLMNELAYTVAELERLCGDSKMALS